MSARPFQDHVDRWQRDMEKLLQQARDWDAHVKVNGNQDLTSMTIDVIVAPPMVHRAICVPGQAAP